MAKDIKCNAFKHFNNATEIEIGKYKLVLFDSGTVEIYREGYEKVNIEVSDIKDEIKIRNYQGLVISPSHANDIVIKTRRIR